MNIGDILFSQEGDNVTRLLEEVLEKWSEHLLAVERGDSVYDSALELVARLILTQKVNHPEALWDYYKKMVSS